MVLTKRQIELLKLIATGLSNKQIALRLDISEQTVKNALTLLFARIGALNRANAVAIAYRQGWCYGKCKNYFGDRRVSRRKDREKREN